VTYKVLVNTGQQNPSPITQKEMPILTMKPEEHTGAHYHGIGMKEPNSFNYKITFANCLKSNQGRRYISFKPESGMCVFRKTVGRLDYNPGYYTLVRV
jgi:hypothetical protein